MADPRTETSSANTKTLLLAGAAVAVVILLVVRPWADKKPADPTVTTSSGTPAVTAPPPVATPEAPAATAPVASAPGVVTSGEPVDMSKALHEAKIVEKARAALTAGDPRKALQELEEYDRIPNAGVLKPDMTLVKIEALSKAGRRTDALALAMLTRDDPDFKDHHKRVEALLADAGLSQGVTFPSR